MGSTASAFLLVTIPFLVLGTILNRELRTIFQSLQEARADAQWSPYLIQSRDILLEKLGGFFNLAQFDLQSTLLRWTEDASRYLLSIGTRVLGNLFSLVLNTIVVLFTLFFFFREGHRMRAALRDWLPFTEGQTERLLTSMAETIVGNLYGCLAVGLAQGALTGLAFWTLGMSAPVLWAIVTAFASLVAVVGSALVWAPAALILMMTGHWLKALALAIWGAAVVGQIDAFVRPWVVSAHVKIHTLLMFFAMLGGVKAFGVIGIFLGPMVVSFTVAILNLLRSTNLSFSVVTEKPEVVVNVHGN